jgi:hypothetical protein
LKPETIYFKVGKPIYLDRVELEEGQTYLGYVKNITENLYNEIG